MTQQFVNGVKRTVLVDTGCSKTMVHMSCCPQWNKNEVNVMTVGGELRKCKGVGQMYIKPPHGLPVNVDVLVVSFRPLIFDLVLGMNAITAVGGVIVLSPTKVELGGIKNMCGAVVNKKLKLQEKIEVVQKDFKVIYNRSDRTWTVQWEWGSGTQPEQLLNSVSQYHVLPEAQQEFDAELNK